MLLKTVLAVVTWTVGILVTFWLIVTFWRTLRSRGLLAALRSMVKRVPVSLALTAIGLSLLYLSLVFVEPQQVGVVVSLIAPTGYRDQPLRSGLRWIVPLLEEATIYPISYQTYTMASKPTEGQLPGDDSIMARTSDGQEVSLDTSTIYQIDTEEVIRLHIEWQHRYVNEFVRPVVRGLVRTFVSQYTVDEVNSSKRLDLERDLDQQIRRVLQDKGLMLDRFILRNVAFSKEYAAAVEQKQIAQQAKLQAENEAEKARRLAQGEADATRTKAGGQADALKLVAAALAQNRNLLTYHYIDKLSPRIQVMLVPNNAPLILPLPQLEAAFPATPPAVPKSPEAAPPRPPGPVRQR
ncbi:MAG: prohibitin family protein [Acidobacteriota bacterium]